MKKISKLSNLNRIFAILLIIVVSFILAGCGGKKQPDNKLITQDLENKVSEYCQNLTLSSYDVTESLTDEGRYEATLSLDVKSKYANIILSAEVLYIKYDQGWKLENCDLQEVSREINFPTDEEILKILKSEEAYRVWGEIISLDKVVECIDDRIVVEATYETNLSGLTKVKNSRGKENLKFVYKLDDDTDGFIYDDLEIVIPEEKTYLDLDGKYELTEANAERKIYTGEGSPGFGNYIEIKNSTETKFDLILQDISSSNNFTYEMERSEEYSNIYYGMGPLGHLEVRLYCNRELGFKPDPNENSIYLQFRIKVRKDGCFADGIFRYLIE